MRKKENSIDSGIRAREAVTACHFIPLHACRGCGYGERADACTLADEVPQGADAREWYVEWLERSVAEIGASHGQ